MSDKPQETVADYPCNPRFLQACSLRVTDRILGYFYDEPIRDEWECVRCGRKWIGWPGNGWLCAVLTDGRRVA